MVPSLFDSFRLRGVELRNRVVMSPMVQASAVDGFATDWHLVHLGARAVGSVGLVMAEATAVAPDARVTINDLGLWRAEQVTGLRRITDFLHREGAVAGIQLAHAGRKSNYTPPFDRYGMRPMRQLRAEEGGWMPRAASPVRYSPYSSVPRQMSRQEIDLACRQHAEAAKRAVEAGFDWVEIHAAHGYLPHCFCSPLSNLRTDEYGGSFENRVRLSREIARSVRAVLPADRVLAFRVSYTDWIEGGWTLEETVELARLLQDDGVDLVDVSSGGTAPTAMMLQLTEEMTDEPARRGSTEDLVAKIPVGPGYQVAAAAAIRRSTGLPVAAVGLIDEPDQADRIIRQGEADVVMLGRVLLREPNWVQRAAVELGDTAGVRIPAQYYLAWRDRGEFTQHPVSAPCPTEAEPDDLAHARIA